MFTDRGEHRGRIVADVDQALDRGIESLRRQLEEASIRLSPAALGGNQNILKKLF